MTPLDRIKRWLPVTLSAGLVAWLFQRHVDPSLLARADLGILAVALVASLILNAWVGAWKWRRVMGFSGIHMPYREVWRIWVGLYPLSTFAPFQSGHLLYALALRNAARIPSLQALESVAYDKYVTLVGTFSLMALGQLLLATDEAWSQPGLLLLGGGVLVFYAFDQRVIGVAGRIPWVARHSRLLHANVPWPEKLLLLVVSTVYQASEVIGMLLACWALGVAVDPRLILAVYPVILVLSYLPISVAGFGVREALAVAFLQDALGGAEPAFMAGLVVDLVEYVAPAILGCATVTYVIRLLGGRWLHVEAELAADEA